MAKAKAIPRMKTHRGQREASVRADKLRMLIRGERWSYDETLRAFSSVVFYSGARRRERAIGWLEELLEDLKNTTAGVSENDAWEGSAN